ncbi:MAG TPA: amidohydrolase family protein [Acidimicrobiales bacterium]|nr:amidohydrolase family protein [Acidimicrobiales bacterium]
MALITEDLRVVDADSHMTEMHDLWVSRAPAAYKDRVPRVEQINGEPTWIMDDGALELGRAGGGGVIDRQGDKHPFQESMIAWNLDTVHQAAWDPVERLKIMDECGISHQVLYPNSLGLGGQSLEAVKDDVLRQLVIEIYNDSRAELQEQSNNRLLPMPLMPAWDIDACVREAERVAGMGMRGINMTSDPQDLGSPDLASRDWDPFWAACADLEMPVHFHIGASLTAMNFFGQYFWPSQHEYVKPALGGSMLFINNARIVANTIVNGMFDRHPNLKMVSVESGIGWIPFILETVDYEMAENAPEQFAELGRKPSEYFKDHWYATFWFEQAGGDLQRLVDKVGEDTILFETDFPHPTCLYPTPLDTVGEKMATLRDSSRRKILGENAVKLYRL